MVVNVATAAGVPRNRDGQISNSVVLGTFNVGDLGEGNAQMKNYF